MARATLIAVAWVWVSLPAVVSAQEPKDAGDYAKRGQELFGKGEFDKAIADFSEAIRLEPQTPEYYIDRGYVWHCTSKFDKAIADYNKAVELDSTSATSYLYRGYAWIPLKEIEKSLDDFDKAAKLAPNNAMVCRGRGGAWQANGDFNTAIAAYNQAIQLDPNDPEVYSDRALSWLAQGKYDKALADYDQACRLAPTIGNTWNDRAWIEATCPDVKCRDGKKAVEHATKACQLSEWKNAATLDTLAAAYAEAGDFTAAVKWQMKARDMSGPNGKQDSQSRLDLYQTHKPFRDRRKSAVGAK